MKNVEKKVEVMSWIKGLQYVNENGEEYWMGYVDTDQFSSWFEAYTHQAQIGFRSVRVSDVDAGKDGKVGRVFSPGIWLENKHINKHFS